jgi:TATA-binding protein-associated factor Taf7
MGLLFSGLSAAISFGKVNRVQSHANIMFANAVCLQYEETFPVDDDDDDDDDDDEDDEEEDDEEEDDDDDDGAQDLGANLSELSKYNVKRKFKAAVNAVSVICVM